MGKRSILGRTLLCVYLIWLLLAYIAGASITEAIGLALALSLQSIVGCGILLAVGVIAHPSVIGLVGLGTAVGAGVTTLLFQLVLSAYAGISPYVVLIPLSMVTLARVYRSQDRNPSDQSIPLEIASVVLVSYSLIGLVTGWHMLQAFGALTSFLLLILVRGEQKHLSRIWKTVIALLPMLVISLWFRLTADHSLLSRILWDGDNSISQMLMNTTGRWGVLENVSSIGQSPIVGYHWASFAWMGLLERASSAAPWVVLQFVGPFAATLVIVAMTWDFSAQFSNSIFARLCGVLVSLMTFFRPDGSVSLFITDLWLVALVLVVLRYLKGLQSRAALPLIAILMEVVLVGKRSTGWITVVVGIVALSIAVVLGERELVRKLATVAAVFIGVVVADQLLVSSLGRFAGFEGVDLTGSGGGRVWLEFISESAFGYPGSLPGVPSVVGAIFVTVSIFFVLLLAIWHQVLSGSFRFGLVILASASVFVSALLPFAIAGERLAVYYYSRHVGLGVGSLLLLQVLLKVSFVQVRQFSKRVLVALVTLSLLGAIAWVACLTFLERRVDAELSLVQDAIWIPAAFTLLLFVVATRVFNSGIGFTGVLVLVALIFSGVSALPKQVDETWNERLQPLLTGNFVNADLDIPSASVIEVGRWIRLNTDQDEVVASNHFCEDRPTFPIDCSSPDWWNIWTAEAERAGVFGRRCLAEAYDKVGKLQNYMLSSLANRRFFIQGPGFSLGCSEPPQWITDRIRLSESFARNPSLESCNTLLENDVTYFVVDRRTTNRTSWNDLAERRFANDSFVVLELDKKVCGTL